MADVAEQADLEMVHAVAMARLILPAEVSLQAPPNLNAQRTAQLVAAGLNDFGGISPVTPDYINPQQPWPHLLTLRSACRELGFELAPRLAIYDRYCAAPSWLDPDLREAVAACRERMSPDAFFAHRERATGAPSLQRRSLQLRAKVEL
jgi:FO synthase